MSFLRLRHAAGGVSAPFGPEIGLPTIRHMGRLPVPRPDVWGELRLMTEIAGLGANLHAMWPSFGPLPRKLDGRFAALVPQ